ncbi:MAG TPA: hypothetical protein VMT52_04475 [Planctomycetota bacterium]|nr:hypothetical protein [Planctomycetota bacterium]
MSFLTLAVLVLVPLGLRSPRAQDATLSAELSEEQRNLKELLFDLGGRMQSLAKKLEAGQPEDAKRLREAADRIHNSDLARVFDDIASLLGSASFVEAVGRQDGALSQIDAIIALLERSRFGGDDVEKLREEIEKKLRETGEIAGKQKSLLDRTREILERAAAVAGLKDVKQEVADIQKEQAGLHEGADPAGLDAGADKADEAAMKEALESVRKIQAGQESVNTRLAALPPGKSPIQEMRDMVSRLDELLDAASSLVEGTEGVRDAEMDLKDFAAEGPDGARPEKDTDRTKKGTAAGKSSPAGAPEPPPEGDAVKGGESEGKGGESAAGEEPGDAKSGDAKAADTKAAGAKSGDAKAGGKASEAKPGDAKTADGKTGETSPGDAGEANGQDAGEEKPGAQPAAGKSDVGLAREAQALGEEKERLARAATDLSKGIEEVAGDLGADRPGGAPVKEDVSRSSAGAKKAAEGLEKDDLAAALEGGKAALEGLRGARRKLAGDLARMEEANAGQTAGTLQDQGLLQQEAKAGSTSMAKGAEQSSSESAGSSLSGGSKAMEDAAKSMGESAKALEEGDRDAARSAGEKARQDLARAAEALEKGQDALAKRSDEERTRDLQKKLAKKAEEARKKIAELQKKLRKKGDNKDGALSGAEKALSGAAGAMREAAEAGEKGDASLAKKKREEALEELDKAQAKIDEEERDQLARLEKEALKKDAPLQDELARLTREVAKKSSKGSGSRSGGESQDLEGAAESMDRATESLEKEDAEGAEKEQEEALARLKDRQDELRKEEERLARLQREEEMLSMIEELTRVKDGQEGVNSETVSVHAGREPRESRRQKLRVQARIEKLVTRQGELADGVDTLHKKLKEELARVFTFVLRGVSEDMRQVRDSLKDLDTGNYTQFLQKEVVRDVDRLIAVLKEQLEKDEEAAAAAQEGPPGGENPGVRRLVPPVAELRMLREMQMDVNRGTRDLEDLQKASAEGVTESWERALNRLTQKQGSVSRMTGQILKDFKDATGAPEGEEPEPSQDEDP